MLTDEQTQKLGVKDYDMADYLKSEKECEEYLNAALDENDPEFFVHALGVVARAKGRQSTEIDCYPSAHIRCQ